MDASGFAYGAECVPCLLRAMGLYLTAEEAVQGLREMHERQGYPGISCLRDWEIVEIKTTVPISERRWHPHRPEEISS